MVVVLATVVREVNEDEDEDEREKVVNNSLERTLDSEYKFIL